MPNITRLADAPATDGHLIAYIHTAIRDLRSDYVSAKFYPESDHAARGIDLCSSYFEGITAHW